MWCLKKCVRLGQVAALAAAGAALPVFFASPASAETTGDWGWTENSQTAPAGGTVVIPDTYPRLPCRSETCTYDENVIFDAWGMNGTTITTPVGTTTDLVNGTTGEVIGECTVLSTRQYVCQSNSSGTVTGGSEDDAAHSIHGSGNLEFAIPEDQPQDSVAIHYSWNNGAPQGDPDDVANVIVSGTVPPVPMANVWAAGGGAGLLGLGAVGYVLYRRRIGHATSPIPA